MNSGLLVEVFCVPPTPLVLYCLGKFIAVHHLFKSSQPCISECDARLLFFHLNALGCLSLWDVSHLLSYTIKRELSTEHYINRVNGRGKGFVLPSYQLCLSPIFFVHQLTFKSYLAIILHITWEVVFYSFQISRDERESVIWSDPQTASGLE